jgi:hypothetical protein
MATLDDRFPRKAQRPRWGEPGSRVKRTTTATIWSAGKSRAIMFALYSDGVLETWEKGMRTRYCSFMVDIHRNAVVRYKAAQREAKKKARKLKC